MRVFNAARIVDSEDDFWLVEHEPKG